MSTPSGIEDLMKAERDATSIVQEQRQAKVERMKQAKSEAAAIVDEYRKEKEAEFQAQTRELTKGEEADGLEAQTAQEIAQMKADFKQNKDGVVKMLLGYVTNVDGK